MKRLFLFLLPVMMLGLTACGHQTTIEETTATRYKLYPTFNMWTFLKLDTKLGVITQVQFSLNDDNEFETPLGSINLEGESKAGRFELYPTTNNWTFILLDGETGAAYHVQWNQDASKRGIMPIPNISNL